MKKIISLLLAVMCLLTAVSAFAETTPATVTINAYNAEKVYGEVEVPYDPQRIAVLDMAALDIIDALGLGDRIVGSAKVTIEYLTDYNPDDSEGKIANLGSVKTADMEQVATSLVRNLMKRLRLIFKSHRTLRTHSEPIGTGVSAWQQT